MNIVREDPPGRGGKPSDHYDEIVGKLKADPGNWYKIIENSPRPQSATNIKQARIAAFRPAGSFDAVSRKNDDDTYNVWARYVGTDSA